MQSRACISKTNQLNVVVSMESWAAAGASSGGTGTIPPFKQDIKQLCDCCVFFAMSVAAVLACCLSPLWNSETERHGDFFAKKGIP